MAGHFTVVQDIPADHVWSSLASLGWEWVSGPLEDLWFTRGTERAGPIFLPRPYRGWFVGAHVEQICRALGEDLYRFLQHAAAKVPSPSPRDYDDMVDEEADEAWDTLHHVGAIEEASR